MLFMKKLILILLTLSFSAYSQITSDFGYETRAELPSSYIKALVWNIHGGTNEAFKSEYEKLSKNQHLTLLQEANLNTELEANLLQTQLYYTHAKSYISPLSGNKKGVTTGSVSRPTTSRALRSTVVEFGATTPKAVLVQLYKLSNTDKKLLVVNVHAINFVTNDMFQEHIQQIIKAIKFHAGPALIAGDFNTWNKERLKYVDQQMNILKINRVSFKAGRSSFPNIGRWFGVQTGGEFDQIYIRGLETRYKHIHADSYSSDHKPIEIHFSLKRE